MPYDEFKAAVAIAKLQAENRKLREQLQEALERGDQLAAAKEQLQKRLEELEREAARQAAPISSPRAEKSQIWR